MIITKLFLVFLGAANAYQVLSQQTTLNNDQNTANEQMNDGRVLYRRKQRRTRGSQSSGRAGLRGYQSGARRVFFLNRNSQNRIDSGVSQQAVFRTPKIRSLRGIQGGGSGMSTGMIRGSAISKPIWQVRSGGNSQSRTFKQPIFRQITGKTSAGRR